MKLNVISCHALSETGWLTRLGGARESVFENGSATAFPLRICERAWWLKVDLIGEQGEAKGGGRQTKGPAPMEVDEVKASSSSVGGETRETPSAEARGTESTVPPLSKNETETKDEALAEQARGTTSFQGRKVTN